MSIAAAFIYGLFSAIMGANVVLAIIELKRTAKESEKLDVMGDDILKDIEVGEHYIKVAVSLTERLDLIEEKVNALEKAKTTEKVEEKKTVAKRVVKAKEAK